MNVVMPSVVDDVKNEASGSLRDGAIYGLGTGLGQNMMGPIGYTAGGIVAASQANSDGRALAKMAVGDGLRMLIANSGGNSGGSSGGSRRRL